MSFNYLTSADGGKNINFDYNPLTECDSCGIIIKMSPDDCSLYNSFFASNDSNSNSSSSSSNLQVDYDSDSDSDSEFDPYDEMVSYIDPARGCNLRKNVCYFDGHFCQKRNGDEDKKEIILHISLEQLSITEYINIKKDPLKSIFRFDEKQTASTIVANISEDFAADEVNITITNIPAYLYSAVASSYTEYATVCVNTLEAWETAADGNGDDSLSSLEIILIAVVCVAGVLFFVALGFLGFALFRFTEPPPDPSEEKWIIEPQKATFGHHGTQIDVLKEEKQVIKITSYADYMYKLHYKFILPDGGEKYKLTANKTEGVLKPEETDEVTLTVFLNCTYTIQDSVYIEFTCKKKTSKQANIQTKKFLLLYIYIFFIIIIIILYIYYYIQIHRKVGL